MLQAGFSQLIIQGVPDRSRNMPKRAVQKVSCTGVSIRSVLRHVGEHAQLPRRHGSAAQRRSSGDTQNRPMRDRRASAPGQSRNKDGKKSHTHNDILKTAQSKEIKENSNGEEEGREEESR